MTHRNTSIDEYFRKAGARHQPKHRFAGKTSKDWAAWREALLPAVRATLGSMPRKVPLNPQVILEWREDGLVKQKVLLDVEEDLSLEAYVFRPESATATRKCPAILCCHGHGAFGKEAVMGNRSSPAIVADIDLLNYDYGLRMAKAGFVTMAIDWRGFGDRDDRRKPHFHNFAAGSVGAGCGNPMCDLHYLRATLLGMTALGMDVHDGSRAIDYLCQQDYVDPQRIGVMGLSFGGTMTTWMSISDDRIKAADVICYADRFADFGLRYTNICGSQITPGLFALCDVPDLQGLIAPRPLLMEIGVYDDCFLAGPAMSCFREVEAIYAAAGARDHLELDLFEGGHRWGGNKSVAFFRSALAVPGT